MWEVKILSVVSASRAGKVGSVVSASRAGKVGSVVVSAARKLSFGLLNPEDGIDRLSRNVRNKLSLLAAYSPEERCSLQRKGRFPV